MDGSNVSGVPSDRKLKALADEDPGITAWGLFRKTWPLIRGPRAKARALGIILLRSLP
ncbi:MAG: hypothetical protein QNJ13_13110 [Paracoccaceae bacterium]|nr:hypothetical protein [Paracoccaceae bacterium]